VLAAIALQGIRLAAPTLGETFVVTGLGLIGLMAVQLLRANGCRVLGLDGDPARLALARGYGAECIDISGEDPVAAANAFSRGRGVDGVILTLSSKSSEPLSQAAKMCRKRGRIVLVGVTGLEMSRADFYEKELSFQVSCSYGPGRYDVSYEERGQDYPIGFVRWTEQRNFEAVLDMMAAGALDVSALISHRFEIDQASDAYDILASSRGSLGILLTYSSAVERRLETRVALTTAVVNAPGAVRTAFIGAGNYAGRVLVKAFAAAGAQLDTIASTSGVSATYHGRRAGFASAASDPSIVFADPQIDTVCIGTRHDSHARFVMAGLAAGKHVFVEKPLCLSLQDLASIEAQVRRGETLLMVGFNRRFAPMVVKMRSLLANESEPKAMVMTVNAGPIPNDSWIQDPAIGGGRVVGEACHFIDLLRNLAGSPISRFRISRADRPGGPPTADVVTITLDFEDGSFGVVNYLANGAKTYPKERLEVFCGGKILLLDNFRRLTGHGFAGFSKLTSWKQDKGQAACVAAFVAAVRTGGVSPIPLDEILEVSRIAIEAAERPQG
jgi:predicted dehydrogenase